MRIVYALAVVMAFLAWSSPLRGQAPAAAPASCEPAGPVKFVCGQAGPEDLVAVPGTRWLIASAFGGDGGLFAIDTSAASSTKIYPIATAVATLDKATYDTCPGPPQTAPRFQTHGLFIHEAAAGRHTLYVVHHGSRESVEVFDLDARGQSPTLAWIGCAIAPDPIGLNSVLALPGGGFVATNFQPRAPAGAPGAGFQSALTSGQNNGELWEWHTGRGWAKVPGSESAGANGLEMSKDGKWAIQIGDELWAGSFRGDRIARYPAKGLR